MREDRRKWNRRHQENPDPGKPNDLVKRFWSLVRPGRALDLASGLGRHALFLAEQGFTVEAVDISDFSLRQMKQHNPKIHALCVDLDTFEIPSCRYELIVNINFLKRRLFPYIQEGLKPGGLLIFQTFMEDAWKERTHRSNQNHSPWPSNRDYLLRPNELLHSFLSLRILWYEETRTGYPKGPALVASLVARKRYSPLF